MLGKISPAFEPFMADSGLDDKREAIVIFQAPTSRASHVRGRLRELKHRLAQVKTMAAANKDLRFKSLKDYQQSSVKHIKRSEHLAVASIGKNALPVATVEVTRKTLSDLAARDGVVAILPNQRIQLIKPTSVDYEVLGTQETKDGLTWGLKQLNVREVWKTSKGKDINVAVLDTGVFGDHPALTGRVKKFVVIDPLGRRIQVDRPFDAADHGTHVCGTIAGGKTSNGVSIGVAPDASLLVAGVLVGNATLSTLMEGISWAVENGADIINMSLGFSYYEPLFAEVFNSLMETYGILPVVAIGNENHGNSSSPGNAYSAFSVGAVERFSPRKTGIASFSSGASLVFPGDEHHGIVTKPDIVAPGVQVYSAIPPQKTPQGTYEYSYMHGTSMATPHVAGAAALLMAAFPEVSTEQIISVLKTTAWHPDDVPKRPDNRWGYGLIRPLEALKALKS